MAKTYNDIYIQARRTLKNAGIEACGLEARLIVAQAAGKTVAQLMRDLPLYAGTSFEKTVQDMVQRRLTGEPVAYITGGWEFYGVPLEITRDVLIPRPDTEVMVEAAIRLFAGRNPKPRILDLCAGSGCIGCALGVHMPGSRVVLVDNDHKALAVCRKNVEKNALETRVVCIDADATQKPPMLLGKFDLLVCNAPYIPTAEIETLDASVKDYEPYAALDGGEDGLDIIRPVVSLWKSVLRDRGTIMLEIGEGQSPAVQALLAENGFGNIHALPDTGGTERVVVGQLG
jgi:release factor glutamine methyltransferase